MPGQSHLCPSIANVGCRDAVRAVSGNVSTNSVVRVERTMRPAPAAPAAAAVARNLRRFPASGPLLSRRLRLVRTGRYCADMAPRRKSPAGFVEPCIPTLATKPPSGTDWVHEIKHDGYRAPSLANS
jgi:ATP-dependent DNA ligase